MILFINKNWTIPNYDLIIYREREHGVHCAIVFFKGCEKVTIEYFLVQKGVEKEETSYKVDLKGTTIARIYMYSREFNIDIILVQNSTNI